MNDGSPTPPLEVIVETLTILKSRGGETAAPPPPASAQKEASAPKVAPPPVGDKPGETEYFQSELHLPAPENPNQIGPFGWVGIVFLCCLFFACLTNIYLNRQKKGMEAKPPKAELTALLASADKA